MAIPTSTPDLARDRTRVVAFSGALALFCITAIGWAGQTGLLWVTGVFAAAAVWMGVARHRPAPSWPLTVLATAVATSGFTTSGRPAFELATHPLNDPTLHDLVAFAAYLAGAAALLALIRHQGRRQFVDVLLDAGVVAAVGYVCAWVLWLSPGLGLTTGGAPPLTSQALLAAYPAAALFVAVAATRLAGKRHTFAASSLVTATVALLVAEAFRLATALTVLPGGAQATAVAAYGLAFTAIGAAALHPTVVELGRTQEQSVTSERARRIVVSGAMLLPGLLLLAVDRWDDLDRIALGSVVLAISVLVVARLERAVANVRTSAALLVRQATHDPLTGLPGRGHLPEVVSKVEASAHEHGGSLAAVLIDLDRFHRINESFGHEVGDQLLIEIASRLRGQVREEDGLVRLGADEFLVVARVAAPGDAQVLAQRLLRVFDTPSTSAGARIYVTAAVGVAQCGDGPGVSQLVRHASAAAARAKQQGPGTVTVYDPTFGTDTRRSLAVESALRGAVDRRELTVAYQPQVQLDDGSVVGAEALVRWEHPELGRVSPEEFIPVAETTGLVAEIGSFVLDQACEQLALTDATLGQGALPRISVNASAVQLASPGFAALVSHTLDRHGLAPERLMIEITETALLEPTATVAAELDALRATGVALALDDFGTGYSSLSYLSRERVNEVKVDRSFTAGLIEGGDLATLVATILAMARSMRIEAVVEGVETEEQAAALRDLGCPTAQGYLYAAPLTSDALLTFLADRRG